MPGDVLDIIVHRQEDLKMTIRVGNDGYISYPYCGRIMVKGKDVNHIEEIISKGLVQARHEAPQVIVSVKSYTPRMVYVFGEVKGEGTSKTAIAIPPGGEITVMQALSTAGGITEKADLKNISVLRKSVVGQKKILLDVRDIMRPLSDKTEDFSLQSGDVVMVPSMQKIYVHGRVNQPGGFYMPQGEKMTLTHILALAGGTERPASEKKLKVIRGSKIIDVDLSQVFEGGKIDVDLQLQAGDVVYVPQSRW